MPKHDFFSPKAVSNRMKAKGLQKLRWYCEMCQKQCRDENGFKCHLLSDSHNRQMQLFVEHPGKYLDEFSREFQSQFLKLLRQRHGTKRVHANVVYQEYISDKQHTHMNATKWTTLAGFVKHLGRSALCEVSETEKGWFITYIDRDPIALAKQEALENEDRSKKDEAERQRIDLEKQIERAFKKDETLNVEKEIVEFKRDNEDQKVVFSLTKPVMGAVQQPLIPNLNPLEAAARAKAAAASAASSSAMAATSTAAASSSMASSSSSQFAASSSTPVAQPPPRSFSPVTISAPPTLASPVAAAGGEKRKRTALEEIMAIEETKKEKVNRKDYWLFPSIVVKVMNKQLANGKYYKQKGVVINVIDKYIGEIEMVDSGDIIRVDQQFCETVIPNVGGKVKLVNGAYRGEDAVLVSVDTANFNATLKITGGPYNDRVVDRVDYEDFCKLS